MHACIYDQGLHDNLPGSIDFKIPLGQSFKFAVASAGVSLLLGIWLSMHSRSLRREEEQEKRYAVLREEILRNMEREKREEEAREEVARQVNADIEAGRSPKQLHEDVHSPALTPLSGGGSASVVSSTLEEFKLVLEKFNALSSATLNGGATTAPATAESVTSEETESLPTDATTTTTASPVSINPMEIELPQVNNNQVELLNMGLSHDGGEESDEEAVLAAIDQVIANGPSASLSTPMGADIEVVAQ